MDRINEAVGLWSGDVRHVLATIKVVHSDECYETRPHEKEPECVLGLFHNFDETRAEVRSFGGVVYSTTVACFLCGLVRTHHTYGARGLPDQCDVVAYLRARRVADITAAQAAICRDDALYVYEGANDAATVLGQIRAAGLYAYLTPEDLVEIDRRMGVSPCPYYSRPSVVERMQREAAVAKEWYAAERKRRGVGADVEIW